MSIMALESKARKHWKEWLPQRVKDLKAEGIYEETLRTAAVNAQKMIQTLMKAGYPEWAAEEVALKDYILLDPEPEEPDEEDELAEAAYRANPPNWPDETDEEIAQRELEEWLQSGNPQSFNLDPSRRRGNKGAYPFTLGIDVKALDILLESAWRGYRVYELMSLRRPGDVLQYYRVRLVDVNQDVQNRVDEHLRDSWSRDKVDPTVFSLPEFDRLFSRDGDDMPPDAECWLRFMSSPFWRERMTNLFGLVMDCQQQLRNRGDYLVQHELDRITQGTHWRDFVSDLPRHTDEIDCPPAKTGLSPALFHLIEDLISRETVQSVSCPLTDYALWRLLVEQQVRRAELSGKPPQEAFNLSGPDSGLPFVVAEDWGGKVHIPYEGACTGDIFIKPGWRKFSFDSMKSTCRFLLTQEDYGEQECASRTVVDEWVLYEYKGS